MKKPTVFRQVRSTPVLMDVVLGGLIAICVGCGSSDAEKPGAVGPASTADYKTCTAENQAGEFSLIRNDQGEPMPYVGFERAVVFDAIDTRGPSRELMKVGACRLLLPAEDAPPCAPECKSEQTCTKRGCVPTPKAVDVGQVSVTGLKSPFTLKKNDDTKVYFSTDALSTSAIEEGKTITLAASGGAAGYGPFSLKGAGIAALKIPATPLPVKDGDSVVITWDPPAKAGPTRVFLDFSFDRHGSALAKITCDVPDTGSTAIDATLVRELFKRDVTGYPNVRMVRRSSDTTQVKSGCVQFQVGTSDIERALMIPGLVSCGQDSECSAGQKCLFKRCK